MAARSHLDRAERVTKRNDIVRLDALKILRHVLHARAGDPDQVVKDSLLSKGDAPFYLHAAMQIGGESVKREVAERPGAGTTLNVLIMGQAPSNEAWLQAVKDSQQPKAIEAAVVVVDPKEPVK